MRWVTISGLPGAARKLMIWPAWRLLAWAAVTGASTTMSPTAMVGVMEPEMIVMTGCPKTTRWPSAEVREPMAMVIVSTATSAIRTVTVVVSARRYQRRGLVPWPGLVSAGRVVGAGAVVTLICLLLYGRCCDISNLAGRRGSSICHSDAFQLQASGSCHAQPSGPVRWGGGSLNLIYRANRIKGL